MVGINAVHAFRRLPVILPRSQGVHHVDSLDDQYAVLCFFHFSTDFGDQFSTLGADFAHFQCAAKCAHQSTTHRGHQIINSSGMRFADIRGVDAIVRRNRSVNTEGYGI